MKTHRLKRVNEELLVKDQERAKKAMALRTALNEARAGKQQLRAIFNAVSDALVGVDNQWQVKNVNRAAESIFVARLLWLTRQLWRGFSKRARCSINFLDPTSELWRSKASGVDAFWYGIRLGKSAIDFFDVLCSGRYFSAGFPDCSV